MADVAFGTLAALVHSTFVVGDGTGGAQALKLVEAELTLGGDGFAGAGRGESFSLCFRGDATRRLGQNTYSFDHSRIGRFEMFIVPIGREDQSGCFYEAVFNRPLPESRARAGEVGYR